MLQAARDTPPTPVAVPLPRCTPGRPGAARSPGAWLAFAHPDARGRFRRQPPVVSRRDRRRADGRRDRRQDDAKICKEVIVRHRLVTFGPLGRP